MEELAQEFVRRREVLRRSGAGVRVPEDLRRMAVRYGGCALEHGESLGGAAAQLGVSRATLESWLAQAPVTEAAAVREVVVKEVARAGSGGKPMLVTPEGFRIEGLMLAELVRSLR